MSGFFPQHNKPLTTLQELCILIMDDIILQWKVDNKAFLTI
ncbi:hypothetical protein [Methanosphaera sp.]|jgi:hypothetical protein